MRKRTSVKSATETMARTSTSTGLPRASFVGRPSAAYAYGAMRYVHDTAPAAIVTVGASTRLPGLVRRGVR